MLSNSPYRFIGYVLNSEFTTGLVCLSIRLNIPYTSTLPSRISVRLSTSQPTSVIICPYVFSKPAVTSYCASNNFSITVPVSPPFNLTSVPRPHSPLSNPAFKDHTILCRTYSTYYIAWFITGSLWIAGGLGRYRYINLYAIVLNLYAIVLFSTDANRQMQFHSHAVNIHRQISGIA